MTSDGRLDDSSLKWVVNPFDEIALEEAVRLREAGHDAEIVAVTVGDADSEEQLRQALAMGADRAFRVEAETGPDPTGVSRLLAEICLRENVSLVLMGKQAIDDDCNQVGQMLAARLGWPQATFASDVNVDAEGGIAEVTREVDHGREKLRVPLPAVVTADLRLNEPRYVALPAIIKARSKPLEVIGAEQLGGIAPSRIRLMSLEAPPPRAPGRRVQSVGELVAALREKGLVSA